MHSKLNFMSSKKLQKFCEDFQIKKILKFTGKVYQYNYTPKGLSQSFKKKYYYCEVELLNGIKKILSIPEDIFKELQLEEDNND